MKIQFPKWEPIMLISSNPTKHWVFFILLKCVQWDGTFIVIFNLISLILVRIFQYFWDTVDTYNINEQSATMEDYNPWVDSNHKFQNNYGTIVEIFENVFYH